MIQISADHDRIVDVLLRTTEPATLVVIDDMVRQGRAVPASAVGPGAAIPAASSRIVLLASAPVARSFIDTNRDRLKGRTIVLLPDIAADAPDLVAALSQSGANVQMARAAGDPADLTALASILTAVLDNALVATGRHVTRARFLAAMKSVRVQSPGWPDLDFQRFPRSGTDAIHYVTVPTR